MATTTDESGSLIAEDIYQILLCSPESFASPPEAVARNIRWAREAHPAARHHLLSDSDIRSALGAHFPREVLDAYEGLAPYSFRANLARYCFGLVYGGLFVDIGVRMLTALSGPPGVSLVAFRDYWRSAARGNAICPGLLLTKAGRPELKTAIDMIVANVRDRYYGQNPIEVSGPGLFARAISSHNDSASCWFGQYLPVAPETRLRNFVFVTPDGEIVALGKSGPGADISYLGLTGTNNYGQIWRSRQVYHETAWRWPHTMPQMLTRIGQRRDDGIAYEPPHKGNVVHGPYCMLRAGAYRTQWRFADKSSVAFCTFDVAYEMGTKRVKLIPTGAAGIVDGCVTLDFTLAEDARDVECRMWSDGQDSGRLLEIVIEPA